MPASVSGSASGVLLICIVGFTVSCGASLSGAKLEESPQPHSSQHSPAKARQPCGHPIGRTHFRKHARTHPAERPRLCCARRLHY